MSVFQFKQKSQDFIVEEKLPFKLSGKGDAFYVYIEKRNKTTMDVLNHLIKTLRIGRKAIGIGGLKDKSAITRQWVTVYKSMLDKIGGERVFVAALSEVSKVIKTNRHTKPLGLTDHVGNTFFIRLRAQKNLSQEERKQTEKTIEQLFEEGFPNVFGQQRFGIEGRNVEQGRKIIFSNKKIGSEFDRKFKIQAFCSRAFNQYIYWRKKHCPEIQDGDIVKIGPKLCVYKKSSGLYYPVVESSNSYVRHMFFEYPTTSSDPYISNEKPVLTGPVIGFHMMVPSPKTVAGQQEKKFLQEYDLEEKNLYVLRSKRIYGIRRSLHVYPSNSSWQWDGDDITLVFTLPSGTYASVLTDELMKRVG